jgi:hypothetical protein
MPDSKRAERCPDYFLILLYLAILTLAGLLINSFSDAVPACPQSVFSQFTDPADHPACHSLFCHIRILYSTSRL